jgi:hypothetical protein
LSTLAFTGCTTSQYSWGNYEHALYKYYKTPSELETYAAQLAEVITEGESAGRVPPGMYAEYGYILWSQGKADKAVVQFEREKQAWPESTQFMNLLIHNVTSSQRPRPQSNLRTPSPGGPLL